MLIIELLVHVICVEEKGIIEMNVKELITILETADPEN
jgi:hypothetical protein